MMSIDSESLERQVLDIFDELAGLSTSAIVASVLERSVERDLHDQLANAVARCELWTRELARSDSERVITVTVTRMEG